MNLYLFNANDSAATYGIGSYLRELTRALEGADINIRIVHLHAARPEFEIVKTGRVENWYVPEVRHRNTFSGSVQKLEDYYHNVVYLLRLHIKDTKDLIFHFNYNQSYFLAEKLKTVFECKTVATVHFIKWMLELQGNLSRWQRLKSKPENQRSPFEQLLYTTDEYEGLLYKEVDRVIALSQYTRVLLCSEYQLKPDKVTVIRNGLEDISSDMETDKNVLRRKRHISDKEKVILFVGRLHAAKGLFFLIDAFHKVLETIPDCRLLVVGNGNFESCLKETKNSCAKITFTGLLEKEALHELYLLSDIGVLPSLTEQCSYVVMEMMRHGLPVIGTTGLKEMITDGETGLQIPVTEYDDHSEIDTALLAEKMRYLLQHPAEAKQMGQNGRECYLSEYSMDVFRWNMPEFYRSLFTSDNKKKLAYAQ